MKENLIEKFFFLIKTELITDNTYYFAFLIKLVIEPVVSITNQIFKFFVYKFF